MFEETLVESRGLVGSGTQRWTALGSLMVQCALVGLLIAIPLLRPEVLRMPGVAPPVAVPFLRKPPVVPVEVRATTSASTAMSLPSAGPATVAAGPSIWPRRGKVTDGTAPAIDTILRMGSGGPDLLSMLGVDKFVKLRGSCDLSKLETTILPEKAISPLERQQLILKAHEQLVEIDKRNEAQFGDLLKTLSEELALK